MATVAVCAPPRVRCEAQCWRGTKEWTRVRRRAVGWILTVHGVELVGQRPVTVLCVDGQPSARESVPPVAALILIAIVVESSSAST